MEGYPIAENSRRLRLFVRREGDRARECTGRERWRRPKEEADDDLKDKGNIYRASGSEKSVTVVDPTLEIPQVDNEERRMRIDREDEVESDEEETGEVLFDDEECL